MLPRNIEAFDFHTKFVGLLESPDLDQLFLRFNDFFFEDSNQFPSPDLSAVLSDLAIIAKQEQEKEIGRALALWYGRTFFQPVIDSHPSTYEDLFKAIASISERSVSDISSIMYRFGRFVLNWCRNAEITSLFLMARDAIPFLPVLLRLQSEKQEFAGIRIELLHAVRPLFGIYDEIAGMGALEFDRRELNNQMRRSCRRKLLSKYIIAPLNSAGKCACLDVGYYGTIIKELFQNRQLSNKPSVVYFASANPFIVGYTNILILSQMLHGGTPVPSDFIWVIGDTIEAIPKLYHRYGAATRNDLECVNLFVRPTGLLSSLFAVTHYWHLYRAFTESRASDLDELHALYDERDNRCLLPRPQREYSKARELLGGWGYRSIPPQIEFLDLSPHGKRTGR